MSCRSPLAVSCAAIAAIAAGCGGSEHQSSLPRPAPPAPASTNQSAGHSTIARLGFSVVAQAKHGVLRIYRGPSGAAPSRALRSPDARFPLVVLVKRAQPGWLQVLLPVRPNQSTAWIHSSEVAMRYDAFRVEISLHSHRLTLRRGEQTLDRQRIGVGRAATPTPPGLYYIIQQFRLPDPSGPYGPYALGLSGYSDVLHSFGGGPGQIALHGTNDPGGIGANVSHGCIHLSNPAITRLAKLLPLGTPVQIAA